VVVALSDGTGDVARAMAGAEPRVRVVRNEGHDGFGFAVRKGRDVVLQYRVLEAGYDCAWASRFMRGAEVHDYPRLKLLMNRIVNLGIRAVFRHGYTTPPTRSRPTGAM
jgi:dolichol-phosphate mannosyltransferase